MSRKYGIFILTIILIGTVTICLVYQLSRQAYIDALVAYHNQDMENIDVEIGFSVAKSLPKSKINGCLL